MVTFSSMLNYNQLVISSDLQENAALHCLVAYFKYKIEGATEKLKTIRGSYADLDIYIHDKKDPKNLARHSP